MGRRAFTLLSAVLLLTACDDGVRTDEPVTLAVGNATNATVAVDPRDGTVYSVWIEWQDSVPGIYLSRAATAGAASADAESVRAATSQRVRVNDVPGDVAPHEQAPPQVAVGPEGNVYVVWQNNTPIPGRRFPASDLRFARSTDGGRTFEPAITVNDDAGELPSSHTFHDIAIAEDGTVYVSWIDGRERARAEAQAAARARGGSDVAHETMHDAALPGQQVRVARSTDGGATFGASVVAAREVCPCCRTALAVQGERVFVAYRTSIDNIRNILVARSEDGAATFDPVTVHQDGWEFDGCPHAGAALALDDAGRLHVAWYTGAEGRQGLWHAVSEDDGVTFAQPRELLVGAAVPVSQVRMRADREGTVWLAWEDRRDGNVLRIGRVGGRGIEQVHEVTGGSPALAAGDDVLLAWTQREGSAHVVRMTPSSR